MNRRVFLKGMSLVAMSALFPTLTSAATTIDLSKVNFDSNKYLNNEAQTIMIYLYGGASELGGNLTNFDEIQKKSQNKYNERYITPTSNNFWQQAGGEAMERMLTNGDMNIFRTCYRKDNTTRSHGICTAENQRGLMNIDSPDYGAGIFSTLGKVLVNNSVIDNDTTLPFITMEGESNFFATGPLNIEKFLRPAAMNENLSNPFSRSLDGQLYTSDEWSSNPRPKNTTISVEFDALAKSINSNQNIQDAFDKRIELDNFMQQQRERTTPEGIEYPDNTFGKKLKAAVNVLIGNPDTKVVSLGSGGLGGWDDHSNAMSSYSDRMRNLMESIEVALAHMSAESKDNINIIVFAEFGRNVNLNDSEGWDHGNNQNVYIFGGKRYFNHVGVIGETEIKPTEANHRLYLRPTESSYWFEPYSVAATIYKMYGVTNPELLTGGYGAIDAGLFK